MSLVLSNSSLASSSFRSLTEEDSRKVRERRKEREARSLAIEKAYVHDVYEQISGNFSDSRYRPWPRVKQFLMDLEPGSFVCDVGCGSGKYLSVNPLLYNIGADRCRTLTEVAREKDNEVLICDNMALPYKDDTFDAVLSIAVIHHIATTERRVRALRELARILRVGGKIIISVWSMEQRHRRFESQDVLIPWHKPAPASSADEKTDRGDRDTTTTTCTSEDDVTHYHAYTATGTSDSDTAAGQARAGSRRHRGRHKYGRSISPDYSKHGGLPSSSELSSPNETCYSFVRKAIQKIATNKRQTNKLPWFLNNLEAYYAKEMEAWQLARLNKNDSADSNENGDELPIEIRHLEDNDEMLFIPPLFDIITNNLNYNEDPLCKSRSLNDISVLGFSPKEKRKMRDQGRSVTCDDPTAVPCNPSSLHPPEAAIASNIKSETKVAVTCSQSVPSTECSGTGWLIGSWKEYPRIGSLTSLSSAKSAISAVSVKSDSCVGRSERREKFDSKTNRDWCSESQLLSKGDEKKAKISSNNSKKPFSISLGVLPKSSSSKSFGSFLKQVQSFEKEKVKNVPNVDISLRCIKEESEASECNSPNMSPSFTVSSVKEKQRDQQRLIKVKFNIKSSTLYSRPSLVKQKRSIQQAFSFPDEKSFAQHHFKELARELNQDSVEYSSDKAEPESRKDSAKDPEIVSNDQRKSEEPGCKQNKSVRKQSSLNDEIFSLRHLEKQRIKENLHRQQSLPEDRIALTLEEKPKSLKESFLAVTQNKKFDIFRESFTKFRQSGPHSSCSDGQSSDTTKDESVSIKVGFTKMLNRWKTETDDHGEFKGGLKSFTQKRGVNIDPINVFGLRRDQSLDSATRRGLFHKKGAWSPKSPKHQVDSSDGTLLSPTLRRCCMECPDDGIVTERRLSQGGSDSSKDSSVQSDTSLDSEDSCISVIFVPKPGDINKSPSSGDTTRKSSSSDKSIRSISNSSGSSDSPTGKGSPAGSPSMLQCKSGVGENVKSCDNPKVTDGDINCDVVDLSDTKDVDARKVSPKLHEHKSFELEDLPDDKNPINCHSRTRAIAKRVEMESAPPLSPQPKYDYPIVRHHPLFAKNQRSRPSQISSLLVGENVEYMRKPGDLSKSVQSVRKSTPKLLTFDIFNPETDDLDSDSSISCSSDSAESVISVISDVKNMESTTAKDRSEDIADEALVEESQVAEQTAFSFDPIDIAEKNVEDKVVLVEPQASVQSQDSVISEIKPELEINEMEREIERKSEERKKILMSLLDENKSVLLKMKGSGGSLSKSDTIEEVTWKTTSQLQSMEELRLPGSSSSRSPSSSPERGKDCVSEPLPKHSMSLENINSVADNNRKKSKHSKHKLSSAQKLKQISGKAKEENIIVEAPIEICITEHGADNEDINEKPESTKITAEEKIDETEQDLEDAKELSKEDKRGECLPKISENEAATTPMRRLEKKKRGDSIESTTASIKSSTQLSDSGSVHSHRFSTVSISSNVSSDVSFGNASARSGSSCYLASMSSADFDDRPPLASSFSLSEAEECELLVPSSSSTPSQDTAAPATTSTPAVTSDKKKDQLSPPKPTNGKNGDRDRPKLKSLFKRNSNKSNSSHEKSKSLHSSNGSHDGKDDNGKLNRSRIGTFSSLTPDTSLEQATCVERGSTSFEEELFRNASHDNNPANMDDNPFSASDSEDSAETGGSMTHHRYYHVFREGEIDHIIEKYVENLHIISSYYDHANWCIVAEKVNVWTI